MQIKDLGAVFADGVAFEHGELPLRVASVDSEFAVVASFGGV
jgi:hypothetical protein